MSLFDICLFIKFQASFLAVYHFITQHTCSCFTKFFIQVICVFELIASSAICLVCHRSSQFCSLLALMRSAELVSHSGWLFFSCWSSCGVSEVSQLLSVPLPSCLANVSSASQRKRECQVDCFHLIKPHPLPLLTLRLSVTMIHTQRESSFRLFFCVLSPTPSNCLSLGHRPAHTGS